MYDSCAGKWVSWSAQTLWSKGPVFVPYCSTYYFIVVPPFYCCNARSQYQSQIMKLYCTDTAHFLHTVTPSNCIVCWGYSICRECCVDVKVNFQLHFCSFIWTSLCHNCSVTRFSPCRKLFATETLHCFHQIWLIHSSTFHPPYPFYTCGRVSTKCRAHWSRVGPNPAMPCF